jgi:tRNA (mo5U34)-methyltransferase
VAHWHHSFEIAPGVVTPGSYDPGPLLDAICLPADLTGQRVLDVGPSDGFFSLRTRQRGAEVVSVDYRPKDGHGFAVMERLSGLSFDHRQVNL